MQDVNGRFYRQLMAGRRLEEISKSFVRSAQTATKHKCFLSYHSHDAEEVLTFVESYDDVFIPKVLGITDSDPDIQSDDTDYVMRKIREKYLGDSTVTIVLVGKCTWSRKYIDWEIYSSLRKNQSISPSGLVAIELPSVQAAGATLPARVSDNLKSDGKDGYAHYWRYPTSSKSLQDMIQNAFNARTLRNSVIVNTRARRSNNGKCG